ncbi:MauE/DoxX family redox-associated membrane protein [Sphaerisporangium sp. B11E5]|uniref:MauE/DoxX family redox-associated membrane protein n=1 Tax=Sphaerisporangium sp. B11E5 TaxID=3153563 RepID=UPI00325DC915
MLSEFQAVTATLLRIGLGVFWLITAVLKLRRPPTHDQVRQLLDRPLWAIPLVVRLLPWCELLLGVTLTTGWQARGGAWASAGLFTCFGALWLRAIVRRTLGEGGCGCFGSGDNRFRAAPARISKLEDRLLWVGIQWALAVVAVAVAATQ